MVNFPMCHNEGKPRRRAAASAAVYANLAKNLATLHGTKRKIVLQGTCKVAFFGGSQEQL
jgi:hypothetical protein